MRPRQIADPPSSTRSMTLRIFGLLAVTLLAGCIQTAGPAPVAGPADLVVLGPVWTGVPGAGDAEGIAVRGERIAAVGSEGEIRRWIGPATRVVDAAGGMVAP